MKSIKGRTLLYNLLLIVLLSATAAAFCEDKWTTPTKEELSMTSQPEVPGAAAVYLYREEITDDKLHMWSVYVRLKVLTDKGKDYANVELSYASGGDGSGTTIGDIAGRTIHPDGTIIPFTGKPYEKLVGKTHEAKYKAKVFTLPDVEVGSIVEYRYTRRYDDHWFYAPKWFIQSDLYTRKAHYLWKPTGKQLVSSDERGQLTSSIAWFQVLPPNTELKQTRLPDSGMEAGQLFLEINAHDIPPAPEEEYMPPTSSFTYRVLFYYTPYRTIEDYWKSEGKYWSKRRDKFIGPGSRVNAAVHDLTASSDTPDQKLHKLYAAVMQLENTDFTREHSAAEEKAQGLGAVHSTDDILERKRGSSDQLAALFVAMARAAGLKAYLMSVTNRDHNIFAKAYASFSQLDDDIAIVNIDGKDHYFDPGSRYCPYGHLAWKHTAAGGIRQTDGGTEIALTPSEQYQYSHVKRIGDLAMDQHGSVSGTIKFTFTGDPALEWRHRALSGDNASLQHELRTSVEKLVPGGMEVHVITVDHLEDYEQPLEVAFGIKGPIGAPTGKRLLIPADILMSNSKPTFPHEKREVAVYFHYPYIEQDAVRIALPAGISLESAPAAEKFQFQNFALYSLSATTTPNSVLMHRNYILGEVLYMPKEYPDLRSFYNRMETKDQESVVLIAEPAAAPKPVSGN
ncbi:DUF3857 domain-containing transglutaminase family protein [Edaphobacter bradus]|uniref:DUF3857 domain-containing transglutaminase family protein n=1 Tax=Edaphobacter bradus TaxID=2259016 RepID=UPI0021DF5184|nr:DUF3857 and transglutaminase domain-containing protein [Edaphobacter bradus]